MGFAGIAVAAAGSVIGGAMNASAAGKASRTQAAAIQKALDYTEKNLDPDTINAKALSADITRAKNRLQLQSEIDPALYAQRATAEGIMGGILGGVGKSASDAVAAQAAKEALAVEPGFAEAKQKLIDSALVEAGGALPPDIQAELMKAGLEQAGTATGAATARGAGGVILNRVLGTGGLALQDRAANLLTTASNLDAQRQQILQGLFPKLQAQQLGNLSMATGALNTENTLIPEAGLSGSDVANIWLSRVGAINKLTTQQGDVKAAGTIGQASAISSALGAGFGGLSSILNTLGTKKKTPDAGGGLI